MNDIIKLMFFCYLHLFAVHEGVSILLLMPSKKGGMVCQLVDWWKLTWRGNVCRYLVAKNHSEKYAFDVFPHNSNPFNFKINIKIFDKSHLLFNLFNYDRFSNV